MTLISRRALGASALAAPFLNLTGAYGQDKRKVTLTLPFIAEGSNAFAFVAKANGYWDEAGLDVEISRGVGSLIAAQAVGAGQFQFGLAAGTAGIQTAAKGLPLVSLACCGYDGTMGICVLADSPIKAPKDLAGRKLASTVGSGEYPFLPLFAQRTGLDLSKVQRVQTDANVRQRILIDKEVDAISGFAISFVPPLVAQKHAIRSMLYSHYGMTLYNNVLLTRPETLRDERKLCADMTAGILKALKLSMLEPDAAMKSFAKLVPEVGLSQASLEQLRLGVGIFNVDLLFDPARKDGLGATSATDYEAMTDLVMTYVAGPGDTKPKVADLFTNDFVGGVRLSPAEWDKAESLAKPFRQYLS